MSELQKAGKRIEELTEYLHKCQRDRDRHAQRVQEEIGRRTLAESEVERYKLTVQRLENQLMAYEERGWLDE